MKKLNFERLAGTAGSALRRFSGPVALAFFAGAAFSFFFLGAGDREAQGNPNLYTEKECRRMCNRYAEDAFQEGWEEGRDSSCSY